MANYAELSKPVNNAGGATFVLDKWKRLERFLILGSDAPTYYQNAKQLTRENAAVVEQCWMENPEKVLWTIVNVSDSGRAAKNDPAIFTLALGTVSTNPEARQKALLGVRAVCRTATHLFMFVNFARTLGKGWGRGMKRTVAEWYDSKDLESVAYQMIKYRNREGYDHKRLLETARPFKAEHKALYSWAKGKDHVLEDLPMVVLEFMMAQADTLDVDAYSHLPWEAFPTQKLNDPELWKALLPSMGLTAMIRNLGKMTSIGVIAPLSPQLEIVTNALRNAELIRRSRVHPLSILTAMKTYAQGHGDKGSLTWIANQLVVRALNDAFYMAFQNVQPTGERYLLALDISSSMTGVRIMNSPVNAREGAAAMALVTATMEDNVHIVGFSRLTTYMSHNIVPLPISAGQRMDDVIKIMEDVPFGGTDCGLPIRYALDKGLLVDKFVVYTDNETYGNQKQIHQLLAEYRKKTGIFAKLIVVGMTSTGFTIADPNDAGSLDVVGFDTATPALISSF